MLLPSPTAFPAIKKTNKNESNKILFFIFCFCLSFDLFCFAMSGPLIDDYRASITSRLYELANVHAGYRKPGKPAVDDDLVELAYWDAYKLVQTLFNQAAIYVKGI